MSTSSVITKSGAVALDSAIRRATVRCRRLSSTCSMSPRPWSDGRFFGAVHVYVVQTAPAFVAGLGTLDNLKLESDRYRACVPGPEKRPLCLIVNTDQSPAGVTRDPSREPNSFWRR